MSCDDFREFAIDLGWNAAERDKALAALEHIRACPECQKRFEGFDDIRQFLAVDSADVMPSRGWRNFENRLSSVRAPKFHWNVPLMSLGAIAASLILIVAGFEVGRRAAKPDAPQVVREAPASKPQSDPFTPAQLNHEIKAFDQVSKVFDGRAGWMLVSDRDSDVGLTSDRMADARQVLMLRLTLCLSGQTASEADLLVIPGQAANLRVPLGDGNSLHYRIATSTGEPTRLGLWLDINTPHGGQPLAALATTLRVEPGQRLTAGQLSTSAGEYQLNVGFARAALPEGQP